MFFNALLGRGRNSASLSSDEGLGNAVATDTKLSGLANSPAVIPARAGRSTTGCQQCGKLHIRENRFAVSNFGFDSDLITVSHPEKAFSHPKLVQAGQIKRKYNLVIDFARLA